MQHLNGKPQSQERSTLIIEAASRSLRKAILIRTTLFENFQNIYTPLD
jgi:hypothetical protein